MNSAWNGWGSNQSIWSYWNILNPISWFTCHRSRWDIYIYIHIYIYICPHHWWFFKVSTVAVAGMENPRSLYQNHRSIPFTYLKLRCQEWIRIVYLIAQDVLVYNALTTDRNAAKAICATVKTCFFFVPFMVIHPIIGFSIENGYLNPCHHGWMTIPFEKGNQSM